MLAWGASGAAVFLKASAWALCLVMGRPDVNSSNLPGSADAGLGFNSWDAAFEGGKRDLPAGCVKKVFRSEMMFDGTSDGT